MKIKMKIKKKYLLQTSIKGQRMNPIQCCYDLTRYPVQVKLQGMVVGWWLTAKDMPKFPWWTQNGRISINAILTNAKENIYYKSIDII